MWKPLASRTIRARSPRPTLTPSASRAGGVEYPAPEFTSTAAAGRAGASRRIDARRGPELSAVTHHLPRNATGQVLDGRAGEMGFGLTRPRRLGASESTDGPLSQKTSLTSRCAIPGAWWCQLSLAGTGHVNSRAPWAFPGGLEKFKGAHMLRKRKGQLL